jgi:hypothetical protein
MKLLESYIYEEVKKISDTKILDNYKVLSQMSPDLPVYGVKEREDGNYTKEEQEKIDSIYKNFIFIREEEYPTLQEKKFDTKFADIRIVTVDESGTVKIRRMDLFTKRILEEHTASFEDGNYVVDNNYFYLLTQSIYNRTVINADEKVLSESQKALINNVIEMEKSLTDNGNDESYIFSYKYLFDEDDFYEYTSLIPKEKSLEEEMLFLDFRDIYTKGYTTKVTNKKRNIINEDLTIENMDPDHILDLLDKSNPGATNVIQTIYSLDPVNYSHYMYVLEKCNIVGTKLYLLYNDMCSNNFDTFLKVINGLEQNKIDKERLNETLSQTYPEKYESFIKL